MKLFIFQHKAHLSKEAKSLELLQLQKMINEGVVLLDGAYGEPVIIDAGGESANKHDGLKAGIVIFDEAEVTETLLHEKKARQERTIKKVERLSGLPCSTGKRSTYSRENHTGRVFVLPDVQENPRSYSPPLPVGRRTDKSGIKAPCPARNEFISYLGEDGVTYQRSSGFIHELREVYEKLKAAGSIELREIEF